MFLVNGPRKEGPSQINIVFEYSQSKRQGFGSSVGGIWEAKKFPGTNLMFLKIEAR